MGFFDKKKKEAQVKAVEAQKEAELVAQSNSLPAIPPPVTQGITPSGVPVVANNPPTPNQPYVIREVEKPTPQTYLPAQEYLSEIMNGLAKLIELQERNIVLQEEFISKIDQAQK